MKTCKKCSKKMMKKAKKPGHKKFEKVMKEFKTGTLHSGSKKGPVVKNLKQGLAIAFSEDRKANKKSKSKRKK